jgi:hypothetical protein
MAQVQVIAKNVTRKGHDPEVLVKINLLPRGSGNRNLARRVGAAFRRDPRFADHVTRVKVGSSSVWVYMRPSFELMLLVLKLQYGKPQDVPGQLPLPGMELAPLG